MKSHRQQNSTITASVNNLARPSAMLAIEDGRSVAAKKQNYTSNPHTYKTVGLAKASSTIQLNHKLGRLPTLGLSKYQAGDFGDETRNPFFI